MKIDINYLRNFAQVVIEFGDTEQDPRDAGADLYFFFTPTDIGIEGRKLLPKFVNENELYSEQEKKITIYIDHYGHQKIIEQELSRAAMKNVFYQLSLFDFKFDFFFHSQNGVEKNPKNITLPSDQKHDYKKLDFAEIAKYYRKSHIFFPTHRETQGMLAHEIGLCGGITIMQQWMFPSPFHKQFRHLLYDFENPVDLKKLKIILSEKDFLKKNRDHVMRFISKEKFIETFLLEINTLIEKKFKMKLI